MLYRFPTRLAGPVSIGASSPELESTLGGVPAPLFFDLLRFGNSFSSSFVSFHLAGRCSLLLNPSLLHTLTSRRGGVGDVVYDVHECFVDRHNTSTVPSKAQA